MATNNNAPLADWSIGTLASRCQDETARFRKELTHDTRYCFELFRRAFEENSSEALEAIYQTYSQLVHYWVQQHPAFPALDLPAEYILFDSMSEFVLALRSKSFTDFPTLAAILAYCRRCVHTVIMLEARKKRVKTISAHNIEPVVPSDIDTKLMRQALWQRIEELLPDEADILLARLIFVQGLKPKEIVASFPGYWPQTNDVRVAYQRIKRRLQGDARLRQMLGVDTNVTI